MQKGDRIPGTMIGDGWTRAELETHIVGATRRDARRARDQTRDEEDLQRELDRRDRVEYGD